MKTCWILMGSAVVDNHNGEYKDWAVLAAETEGLAFQHMQKIYELQASFLKIYGDDQLNPDGLEEDDETAPFAHIYQQLRLLDQDWITSDNPDGTRECRYSIVKRVFLTGGVGL